MNITVPAISKPICARVMIPGSKSLTNRALLLAALASGVSELSGILISDDTLSMMQALRALGIVIQMDDINHSCIVIGCGGVFPFRQARMDCRDAGTVARFLVAVCAAVPGTYFFEGSDALSDRPMSGLLQALRRQGAIVESNNDKLPLTLSTTERMPGGSIEVDASDSGQYVSALLMAAPFHRQEVMLDAHDPVCQPFISMTMDIMASFGVRVRRLHATRFSVPVPQRYTACDYVIEPDLSTAACFFAAAGVTGGEVTIQPINILESMQGDARFISLLQKMGCEIVPTAQGLTVRGVHTLRGISVDMRDCSDTFMALAALAPFASTCTTITNIGHTRWQESDRIEAMCQGLQQLGVGVEQGPDWIRIYPGVPHAGEIDAAGDHRIAMAFAVIGLRAGVTIRGAECVTKTCPEFFTLWEQLVH